jgi:selenocysteine lyase/cysteine desulfurase
MNQPVYRFPFATENFSTCPQGQKRGQRLALRRFGLESSVRPSLAFYNNCADVDTLVAAVRRISSARRQC